ncbi:hypothetical protein CPB84DRAFT_1351841 [Gymnopilus junonius]|uniref:Uncharacterized protein n=1 Tax=Gymnopilus junonius TaxID=109634 RepID=A0A9P5NZE8_GYMJU|nr:hypothetical protein CPB84DRAFT_1351841 [Gymnopilus junonius]
MAKPLSPSSAGSSAASTSSSCNAQNASAHSNHPRHRRRRRPKPSSSVTPSSGLLVLLASVASASNVSGSPAPPAFLCPSIDEDDDCDLPSEASSSSIPETTPSPSAFLAASGRHLPDKFSRDSDGVWRRVPSYTLYGSTVSVDCDNSCMQPTEVASPADDQIQDGVVNPISNSTANATSTYDIRNSLPPGWKPVAKPYESRTPLILSVSLVLALFICFFIFGCLFWRTSVKKKHRSNDVEAKARKLPGENDTRELVEKEVKAKQKIWARATARWRANARYSARQRRGKRLGSRLSYAHQSNVSVDRPRSRLADSSLHRSRESSRRASVVSIPDQIDNSEIINTSSPSERQIADSLPPLPARTSSPPAYQHRGQPAMPLFSPSNTSSEQQPSNSTSDPSRRQPYPLPWSPSESIDDDQNAELTDSTSLHVAHVATDDKTILARLAELASSPPDASGSVGVTDVQVSAPVWDDEDVRDLVPDLMLAATQSSDPAACTSAPMFPPPPSKERLAAAERYAYPFSFDDMETLEVEAGPSAPPFQEDPSHHPSHSHMLPSAPPLLDTDEFPQGFHPSAPDWDSITRHNPTEEDAPGQNHDRISTESSDIGPSTSPVHPIPRPTDNIALPGYQP